MSKDLKRNGTLAADGIEYSWEYRHGQRFDSHAGLCGPSVVVCLHPKRTRELMVDFPISAFDTKGKPRNAVLAGRWASVIRSALAAGWEPESRGRAFRINVPDSAKPDRGR